MTLSEIRTLYEYDAWATACTLEPVAGLSEEHFTKDLGSSFGGIHGTLVHIFGADVLWLARFKGETPTSLTRPEDLPTFGGLKSQWERYHVDVAQFIDGLTEEQLQADLHYKDMKGRPYAQVLWQLMQHKVNHSTYHRGQVVTLLRQVGAKPVATDLVAFYRLRQAHG